MTEIDYKKEYNRICQEVAKMLVDNRRNHETPMTPFELLSEWDKIREVKNCSIPDVVGQSEQLFCGDLIKHNFSLSKIGRCIICDKEKDKAK